MRPHENKVDTIKLARMLRNGVSSTECAKEFGVTVGAITQHKKKLLAQAATVPVPVDMGLSSEPIDSMEQIARINSAMTRILQRLEKLIVREETRTDALDAVQQRIEAQPHDIDAQEIFDKIWNNNLKSILSIQMNSINASAEIRKQIELTIKIAETIYNIQNVQEFQADILDVIKEVDEGTKNKIIERLRKRRQVRGLIKAN